MTWADFYMPLQIAVAAWTARNILMRPGMVLHGYFRWLDRQAVAGREWLAKPLGYCDQCFAGQIAFWAFVVLHCPDYGPAMFPRQAAFVCLAVFATYQMQRLEINDD